MAFTAGLKASKQFTSNNQTTNQNTFDRLVTVEEYDIAKGYMYVRDEKNKKYEVFVNPEEVRRSNESLATRKVDMSTMNWMGHSIDEKMKKSIPVGSKVILLRSQVMSNDKTRDLSVTSVHRIVGVPSPETDKTFQGIFTLTYRMDEGRERISRVQHWNPVAIDLTDSDKLSELKDMIDKARENYGQKMGEYSITEPTIGVQFRASIKTDKEYQWESDPAKKAIYDVVDTSLPFDWIPGSSDESGKEIKEQAHVINGEEMMSFAEAYFGYIGEHEQFKDNLDDIKVEVCFYHVYPASKNTHLHLTVGDAEKDKNADKNPLYQLSHRQSYIDLARTEMITGRNAAVNGIIQIASNKLEKVNGKPVEIPNYWVNKVHANNTRGHVHAFIRTADGHKTQPREELNIIKPEQGQGSASSTLAPKSNSQPEHVQAATVKASQSPALNTSLDTDFDPFAETEETTAAPVQETTARKPFSFKKDE